MKGDFTRRTFRHRNHYRGVLLQQGRVALDADWNEQVEIQERLDRTTTRDTVGRHGTPAEAAGMEVVCASGDVTKSDCKETDLRISPGRYYVDGILCENEKLVPLTAQPDLPGVTLPKEAGRYIAYLDVWAEHVTMLERPELREVALGGPDTATRSRTIWQVRLVKPKNPPDGCPPEDPPFTPELARGDPTGTPGKLRARAKAPDDDPEPCAIPTTALSPAREPALPCGDPDGRLPGGQADLPLVAGERVGCGAAADRRRQRADHRRRRPRRAARLRPRQLG